MLDNHDDFGGHAKRNEFTHDGRTYIGYGGTQSIDSPAPYSATAKALITDLGIDVSSYERVRRRQPVSIARPVGRHLLRPGDLRRRQAGRRHVAQSVQGVPGAVAARRQGAGADPAAGQREARRDARAVVGGEEGPAGAHELHRLRDQDVGSRSGGGRHLPDAHLRAVRLRRRRGAGAGRLGAGPARLPGHEPRSGQRPRAELRLDPPTRRRGVLLPLPRRERLGGPPAGAAADPGGGARHDHRRRGHLAGRLRQARRSGVADPHSPQQHGAARGARRRPGGGPRGHGELPARRHACKA